MKPKEKKKNIMENKKNTGSEAETALQQSEASYNALFNTIRQAIYIHDAEGKFIDVNNSACAM